MVELGERPLDLAAIEAVVFDGARVQLGEGARGRVARAARQVQEMADRGEAVYGVTTGFGANRDQVIAPQQAGVLQERLLMSHACGVGEPLPEAVVRAMLLLRINALAQGFSGIRVATLERMVGMLNARLHPVVPELGSVGSSGDLCPLAHMALPLIGHGEAVMDGARMGGAEAMERAGLEPVRLAYKEGIALLNGTQAMTAMGLVCARGFRRTLEMADVVAAMSLEAVGGRRAAFDRRIHELRNRPGQVTTAARVLEALDGSELADLEPGAVAGKVDYVQDAYSIRCIPQVHGACRDVLDHVVEILVGEANAVTDNPLVFPAGEDDEGGAILSGGNFHGEPVAMALDYLTIAICELGSITERRVAKLVDRHHNEGLPAFLVAEPGLNSGMMIPQYVAAALVTENRTQSFPASLDSVPTSASMEDHNSMGSHAGLHAGRALVNTQRIVGIEYLVAAQALDLRQEQLEAPRPMGRLTARAHRLLRDEISFMSQDRVLYPDVERATELISSGRLWQALQQ